MNNKWIATSFNLPANPSRIRVYFWRKFKEVGAVYLRPGVAVLPNTAENRNQFVFINTKITQSGGDATIFELTFINPEDEAKILKDFNEQLKTKYTKLLKDGQNILGSADADEGPRKKEVNKLIKQYENLKEMGQNYADGFKELENGLALLVDTLKESTTNFKTEIREALDFEKHKQ